MILGPRGRGKSVLLSYLVEQEPRRIILDGSPLGEHHGLGEELTTEELAEEVLETPTGLLAFRVRPVGTEADPYALEEGEDVANISLALVRGLLVVEEADRWVDHHPREGWIEHVERGRHYGVGLYMATRRSARLWRSATGNADVLYAFATREPRDVAYIREFAGKAAADRMDTLGDFEHIRVNTRTGEWAVEKVPMLEPAKVLDRRPQPQDHGAEPSKDTAPGAVPPIGEDGERLDE